MALAMAREFWQALWQALMKRESRMALIARLSRDGVAPEVSRPEADKLVAGDPVHTVWSVEERGGLLAGLWQSTPGAWRVDYSEWEYVHILEGISVLTNETGGEITLRAGDSYVIRPGFRGIWRVEETTLKDYVVLL
jgi:uncharacterized protein